MTPLLQILRLGPFAHGRKRKPEITEWSLGAELREDGFRTRVHLFLISQCRLYAGTDDKCLSAFA